MQQDGYMKIVKENRRRNLDMERSARHRHHYNSDTASSKLTGIVTPLLVSRDCYYVVKGHLDPPSTVPMALLLRKWNMFPTFT